MVPKYGTFILVLYFPFIFHWCPLNLLILKMSQKPHAACIILRKLKDLSLTIAKLLVGWFSLLKEWIGLSNDNQSRMISYGQTRFSFATMALIHLFSQGEFDSIESPFNLSQALIDCFFFKDECEGDVLLSQNLCTISKDRLILDSLS